MMLHRADDEVQIGIDSDSALVFTTRGHATLLRLLDGTRTVPQLVAVAAADGLAPAQVTEALSALDSAGLLSTSAQTTGPIERLAAARIRLVGAGTVGQAIGGLLLRSGIGALDIFDDEAPGPEPTGFVGMHTRRSDAVRAMLAAEGRAVVRSLDHWSGAAESQQPELTILAADHPEVDRIVADHLVRTDQPHLVVRSLPRGMSVGPLVLPGRTSCLRCTDLARRDRDPGWPRVLDQLVRLPATAPPALVTWGAATAVLQTLAFLNDACPETAGATLEIGWPDLTLSLRSWSAHPGCGCAWAGPTEWAV